MSKFTRNLPSKVVGDYETGYEFDDVSVIDGMFPNQHNLLLDGSYDSFLRAQRKQINEMKMVDEEFHIREAEPYMVGDLTQWLDREDNINETELNQDLNSYMEALSGTVQMKKFERDLRGALVEYKNIEDNDPQV